MYKKIIVTQRASDWHACAEGNRTIWGCGDNPYAAVSQCVNAHKEYFPLTIQRGEKKDTAFGKDICRGNEVEVQLQ